MRSATPLDQPRAFGAAYVSSKTGPYGSCLDRLRQVGALKALFPREDGPLEAIVINTAGGITGGDRFEVKAVAGRGSSLTVTTQAAERGYRAQAGQSGRIKTQLQAEADSTLSWLPQETILYCDACIKRSLTVELATTARFLMVEPVLFGRKAMGEEVTQLSFRDSIDIRREGIPVFRDGVSLKGDVARQLDRPAIANGARAMASLFWTAPEARGRLDTVRQLLGSIGGASMLQTDMMVLRLLAEDGFVLRRSLLPVLDLLTDNTLPQSWRL